MQESGIEWIGQIPKHWEVRIVKYIGKLISGVGFPIAYQGFYEYEIPFYKVNSIATSEKYIEIKTDTISDNMVVILGAKKIQPNSILFAKVGAALLLNRFRINKYQCCIDNNMASLSLYEQNVLEYIYFAFSLFDFKYIVNNGAIPSINETQIYSIKFPFPPLDEQKKIADFLDNKVTEIDNLIDDTKKLIDKYKEYKQSLITETVTKGLNHNVEMKESGIEWIGQIPKHWEVSRLKYILDKPLQYGANETGVLYDETLPRYIRITDITKDNQLKKDDMLSLPNNISIPFILKHGDILFARSGATVGKTFLYKQEYGKSAFAGYLIKARINKKKALYKYIYLYTLSKSYEIWKNRIFIQSTIQNIAADKYRELNIPLPPINEQEDIANYLDDKCSQIDSIIEEKQSLIEKLEEYKKSLIYEYVTGKKQV